MPNKKENNIIEPRYQRLVAQMVNDKKLPQIVYRMRSVNSFLYDSLINNQLWFSNPQDFNDPFDCDINMTFKKSSLARKQSYFDNYLKPLFNARELTNINTSNISNADFEILLNRAAKKIVRKKGLACFLSNCDNLLMWAHYADSHRGVCLKFDVLEDTTFFSPAKAVRYTQEYPEYDYLDDKNEFVNEMFFTKSNEWSYEGEVRVLKNRKGNYSFKPKALKEIILGCKITENDKNTITKLIKIFYPHCNIKLAVMDSHSFSLNFINAPSGN